GHGQRLTDAADDGAELPQAEREHQEPIPHQPTDAQPRSGNLVHAVHRGASLGDGKAAELDLDEDLDDAADDDQPEEPDARFGADLGRGDQFAGTDDRTGNDEPGT